ncbi:uncharacterized protein ACA1_165590 [Acanthamoeba castellanii str. Neff]|uniref:TFIIF beta subunit N-terminal domain-containing protein n=1 Tax=Acanthamoeba castellanii (strain ATCC 30010 / Neff) TaxID=1257118 RepID=L8HFP1_ACACF|nr:uncharacterized protein ACA1_165590 [Acanthamoeba castellanii str. Neff]ELR24349.1 hypothetical protein ACA1_165590 [Acanthamoeba castellanii str. Neff]
MEKGQQAVAAAAVEREVDMRRAGRRVFLIKAPVYLAKAWAEAGAGADLGRLFLNPAALPVIEGRSGAINGGRLGGGRARAHHLLREAARAILLLLGQRKGLRGGGCGTRAAGRAAGVQQGVQIVREGARGEGERQDARAQAHRQQRDRHQAPATLATQAEEEGGPGAGQDDPDAAIGAHRAHLLLLPATGALVAHGAARVHAAARGLPQGGAQRGLHLQQEVLREDASTFELRPEFREEKKKPAADPPA